MAQMSVQLMSRQMYLRGLEDRLSADDLEEDVDYRFWGRTSEGTIEAVALLARLEHVRRVQGAIGFNLCVVDSNGQSRMAIPSTYHHHIWKPENPEATFKIGNPDTVPYGRVVSGFLLPRFDASQD